jgi:hypothetical protein
VFLHLARFAGLVAQSGACGARNIDALFFMLGWDHYGFDKKYVGTRYVELMFLHPVRSAGHYETETHYFSCSGGSGAVSLKIASGHVTLKLCFRIRLDRRAT